MLSQHPAAIKTRERKGRMSELEKTGAARVNNDNVAKSRVRKAMERKAAYKAADKKTQDAMMAQAINDEMDKR